MSDPALQARNLRLGLRLFALYALFYLAFVLVNAFAPTWGEWQVVGGLNLAVGWGFVLIILAFVLAALYGWMCTDGSDDSADEVADDAAQSAPSAASTAATAHVRGDRS